LFGQPCTIFTNHKSLRYFFTQSELNMRQRWWLELIKEYDLNIQYHPGKANVVTDVLSRKASYSCTLVERNMDSLCQDMQRLNVSQIAEGSLSMLQVTSHLLRDIKAGKHLDEDLSTIKERIKDPKYKSFCLDHSNTLWFGKKACST
jgi:hypothetical protein